MAAVAALAAALVLVSLPAAALAAGESDDWQDARPLFHWDAWNDNNTGAGTQVNPDYPGGETLTNDGPGYCASDGTYYGGPDPPPAGSRFMGATLWYSVVGTGEPMTLSVQSSSFNSMFAVYGPSASDFRCDEDPSSLNSQLTFNAAEGVEYLIQVGGAVSGGVAPTGPFTLDVSAPPSNDRRARAQTVGTGTSTASENFGATTEGGSELTSCGAAPFGTTVWFRWTAPATGDAVFVASNSATDSVLGVYAAGGARLDCNDDAVGSGTSSRVPARVRAGQTYEVQVGGYGAGGAADMGEFNLGVEFTQDFDVDDDNSSIPADCNDDNPNVNPNAEDVKNGIDDNCDKIIDPDGDEDKYLRPPLGRDCNDRNKRVHPGAVDVRGNKLNEDCVGKPAPFRRIGADVRLRGTAADVFSVTELLVMDVPRGAKLSAGCTPGCGTGHVASAAATKRVVGISKQLRPGSVISVRVTKRGQIGFFQRLTIRPFAAPKYDRPLCTMPGSKKPRRKCPGVR